MERKLSPAFGTLLAALWSCNVFAGPVNINTADAATLAAELNGIGPALAEAIVRDRTENGKYDKAETLMRVRGIGNRVIELNRENILVSDPEPAPAPAPSPSPAG
jgi:competence protein ComEA